MIDLVWGGMGRSKTAYATWKLFIKVMQGYIGCANYKVNWVGVDGLPVWQDLPDVIDLRTLDDIKNLPMGLKYGVLDEIYKTAHSRRSSSRMNLETGVELAQSRKSEFHCCLTTQRAGKMDLDLRDLAEVIHEPTISLRRCTVCGYEGSNEDFGLMVICPGCDSIDTGKPIYLMVKRYIKSDPVRSLVYFPVGLVDPILNIDIPASYDTHEYVSGFSDDGGNLALIEKYKDTKLSEDNLVVYIRNHEGLRKGVAAAVAREVFMNR